MVDTAKKECTTRSASVTPDPNHESMIITLNPALKKDHTHILITDIQGNVLFTKNTDGTQSEISVDVKSWSSGQLNLSIQSEESSDYSQNLKIVYEK